MRASRSMGASGIGEGDLLRYGLQVPNPEINLIREIKKWRRGLRAGAEK